MKPVSVEDAKAMETVPEPVFSLPVDSEHKSTIIRMHSIALPHMRAFHLSWLAFFTTFVSTFAPAALITVIRQDLNLTKDDLGNAGIAAVCGAIGARVFMGNFLDVFGPRYGLSAILLLTAPAVFGMAVVENVTSFICIRFFIGLSLATFVCCQFWCSSMFNTKIVGTANAIAAGWGNLGGGATHFIMVWLAHGIQKSAPVFLAWRWAFFLPGAMHVVMGALVLCFSQDLPDGDYRTLRKSGAMAAKPKGWEAFRAGFFNYRTWILTLTYGYCFGVELTVDNWITTYFVDNFNLDLELAGTYGSIFGLMNIFSRASGGMISDISAKYFGMPGRLWSLWIVQTLGGVFCLAMGTFSNSLNGTLAMLVIFSYFCQAACGNSFGVTPFISKRALGLVSGMVGAGGNAGSAVTQAIFFVETDMSQADGFKWMGVMIIGMTSLLFLIYFPMWGGMLAGPKEGVTEEDYYIAEYTPAEISEGIHNASLKFAHESKSERGWAKADKAADVVSQPPVVSSKV